MADWARHNWSYFVSTPPASGGISLALAKEWLKIDNADDDTVLSLLISSVTECAENWTKRTMINTGFTTYRNSFSEIRDPADGGITNRPIVLRRSRLQSVDTFSYVDDSGSTIPLMEGTDFFIDLDDEFAKLRPLIDETWPVDLRGQENDVKIIFTAGYGATDASIPSALKIGMLEHLTFMYQNRGDCAGCDAASVAPASSRLAYNNYRIVDI